MYRIDFTFRVLPNHPNTPLRQLSYISAAVNGPAPIIWCTSHSSRSKAQKPAAVYGSVTAIFSASSLLEARNHVNPVFSIGGWTGKENFPRFMLRLHPNQMLVQADRPLSPRLDWTPQY
jgi:hypothetical protein